MVDGTNRAKNGYDASGHVSIVPASQDALRQAAEVIQDGGVVVMPTETVYGLACDAMNDAAVARVFDIKGRPSDNPLIVHVASFETVKSLAVEIPQEAKDLAERFWPGPLTLVLKKRESVPYRTTGGLDTVAVRMPNHPVALELVRLADRPIAAPSANLFSQLSPTRAQDVDPEIAARVMVLDGGPCDIGLESTVLDLSAEEPQVLRPGGIGRGDIESVLKRPLGIVPPPSVRKSPGLYRRHYAPRATVRLVETLRRGEAGLTFGVAGSGQVHMPLDARAYAANLYSALKRLDDEGHSEIAVELPPDTVEWEAVVDRLKKASS